MKQLLLICMGMIFASSSSIALAFGNQISDSEQLSMVEKAYDKALDEGNVQAQRKYEATPTEQPDKKKDYVIRNRQFAYKYFHSRQKKLIDSVTTNDTSGYHKYEFTDSLNSKDPLIEFVSFKRELGKWKILNEGFIGEDNHATLLLNAVIGAKPVTEWALSGATTELKHEKLHGMLDGKPFIAASALIQSFPRTRGAVTVFGKLIQITDSQSGDQFDIRIGETPDIRNIDASQALAWTTVKGVTVKTVFARKDKKKKSEPITYGVGLFGFRFKTGDFDQNKKLPISLILRVTKNTWLEGEILADYLELDKAPPY